MGKCPDLVKELSDYIDELADPAVCAEIERHLQDCPDCKVMVDTLRKTITLYQDREEKTSLPADVRRRLYRVLDLKQG
jgi:anti-sigma factor RsiW